MHIKCPSVVENHNEHTEQATTTDKISKATHTNYIYAMCGYGIWILGSLHVFLIVCAVV